MIKRIFQISVVAVVGFGLVKLYYFGMAIRTAAEVVR